MAHTSSRTTAKGPTCSMASMVGSRELEIEFKIEPNKSRALKDFSAESCSLTTFTAYTPGTFTVNSTLPSSSVSASSFSPSVSSGHSQLPDSSEQRAPRSQLLINPSQSPHTQDSSRPHTPSASQEAGWPQSMLGLQLPSVHRLVPAGQAATGEHLPRASSTVPFGQAQALNRTLQATVEAQMPCLPSQSRHEQSSLASHTRSLSHSRGEGGSLTARSKMNSPKPCSPSKNTTFNPLGRRSMPAARLLPNASLNSNLMRSATLSRPRENESLLGEGSR